MALIVVWTAHFTTKDGRSCRRLEIKVTDKTTRTISLILWDPTAQTFSEQWIPFHTSNYYLLNNNFELFNESLSFQCFI